MDGMMIFALVCLVLSVVMLVISISSLIYFTKLEKERKQNIANIFTDASDQSR